MCLHVGLPELRRLETVSLLKENVGPVTDAAESSRTPSQHGWHFEFLNSSLAEVFRIKGQADAVRVRFAESRGKVELQSFDSELGQVLVNHRRRTENRILCLVKFKLVFYSMQKNLHTRRPSISSRRLYFYPDYASGRNRGTKYKQR